MTRSYRTKNHDLENLPRHFGKSFASTSAPHKAKKNGGGRGNWGSQGIEAEDVKHNPSKPRRRSNVSVHMAGLEHFKTKFEIVEDEPVFIERIHGPASVPFDDDNDAAVSIGSLDESASDESMIMPRPNAAG